ncbi:MAG TPA: IPT/TIG domain-containing protein [Terracidiphilus sp.]|jgi:hypothetical protein|nr:IPT/TIG domain-containing protein [Terracidiphilus sp.]
MHSAARITILLTLFSSPLYAAGPRLVAGPSYFNPGVMGQPIHWANGKVNYYVDPGPLSSTIPHAQAVAMVDSAAALWNAVPTAGVALVDTGTLNEDVSGANAIGGVSGNLQQPSDVAASATAYPVGVIFDADGSVIDAIFGPENSDPSNCEINGVMVWTDNIQPDATIAHAILLLNGRCTDTPARLQMMNFLLERAFGEVLGLGPAQVYPHAVRIGRSDLAQAWPVMQPQSGFCGPAGGTCISNSNTLQYDDIASINRLYPITSANLAAFPGKVLTVANTVALNGVITFRAGTGMQGVNVLAVPLDANGNPLVQYTVTAVSGAYFNGNHGNDVTGWNDTNGVPLSQYGSTDVTLQGSFDLGYMPLPPGMTSATYQISFEAVDPMFTYQMTVGPYLYGSPLPSGTLAPITVPNLGAGGAQTLTIHVADSAAGDYQDAISIQAAPRLLPASGFWSGRISQVGQTDWFNFPVRGNRTFSIITVAMDENGLPNGFKAMPAIGIWDAFDPVGAPSVGTSPGLNGYATGESWLRVTTDGDDIVRLGIADMRGDGRPDYAYNGWVLYADTVQPSRLPASGGPIVIRGMGFHAVDTVLVGGQPAQVTSISPNEITAIAPRAAAGVTGSVDVEVDDLPVYYAGAILTGGISYDSGTGDALNLVTAPANTIPIDVPIPFTVTALGSDLNPAGGVTVTFKVAGGNASLGCGRPTCSVTATGDGLATMNVTAADATASVVIASLCNGASLQAHFSGGTPPALSAITPSLSLAAGAILTWTAQALVLKNGAPVAGQLVAWQTTAGISTGSSPSATSAASGIASKTLTVGPLTEGQQATATACLNGTTQCVPFNSLGARPEFAWLEAVSGAAQSMAVTGAPALITLRVRDMDGNPMAGGAVTFHQSVYAWAPPCPPHGRCAQSQLLGVCRA